MYAIIQISRQIQNPDSFPSQAAQLRDNQPVMWSVLNMQKWCINAVNIIIYYIKTENAYEHIEATLHYLWTPLLPITGELFSVEK